MADLNAEGLGPATRVSDPLTPESARDSGSGTQRQRTRAALKKQSPIHAEPVEESETIHHQVDRLA